jgi:hypothetical protein
LEKGAPIKLEANDLYQSRAHGGQRYAVSRFVTVLLAGLLFGAASLEVGLALGFPPNPPQVEKATKRDIRSVDFRNFDYPSDCWKQITTFDKVMHVSNGEWRKPVSGSPGVYYIFSVHSVGYGELGPRGEETAVVRTWCGGAFNWQYTEIYVFGTSSGTPKLLARLSPNDWGAGEEDNGSFFGVTGVQVLPKRLQISFVAGGFHAEPKWVDTATFQWRGYRLVRTSLRRKAFSE